MPAPSLEELFFELSHATRTGLLTRLHEGPENLTALARQERVSPQEASRHLSRLQDAGLVAKEGTGAYRLTPLGESVVDNFDLHRLLVAYHDYFRTHDLGFLPVEFRKSLGVLERATFVTRNVEVVREVRVILEDASAYVQNLAPSAFDFGYPHVAEKSRQGIPYRGLFEETYVESDFHRDLVREHKFDTRYVQTAVVEHLGFWLLMNESRAILGFFLPDGEEDTSHAFLGDDPVFHDWCEHLFEHYWHRARRL